MARRRSQPPRIRIPKNMIFAFVCFLCAGLIVWKVPPVNIYVIFSFAAFVAVGLYFALLHVVKPLYGALVAVGMGLIGFLYLARMLDLLNLAIVIALLSTIVLYIRQEKSV